MPVTWRPSRFDSRLLLSCALALLLSELAQAQPGQFSRDFAAVWHRATDYTFEVAESMPDSLYGYRPVDSVFSFAEHLLHLEHNLYSLSDRFVAPGEEIDFSPSNGEALGKPEILTRLRRATDHVQQLLDSLPDTQAQAVAERFWGPDPITQAGIFLLMRDHMTHHRGQLIVYLRLNGIRPPRYRGW